MVKVVFIGGLTSGKIVYDFLANNKFVSLILCITYPDNTSKPNSVNFTDAPHLIKDISANKYIDQIQNTEADYIIVAGWSELLQTELVQSANKGTIGFHPSRLPNDRGRSVLAWQIEEGYTSTALTMFYYNDLPDCGDIIAQENINIENQDTIKEVLSKMDMATNNLMKTYFPMLLSGTAPRNPQNYQEGNFRRLRSDKDSEINWNRNSIDIYNKVRAITSPYPGATATIKVARYRVWKSVVLNFPIGHDTPPGTLVATLYDQSLVIKTRDGFLQATEWERI